MLDARRAHPARRGGSDPARISPLRSWPRCASSPARGRGGRCRSPSPTSRRRPRTWPSSWGPRPRHRHRRRASPSSSAEARRPRRHPQAPAGLLPGSLVLVILFGIRLFGLLRRLVVIVLGIGLARLLLRSVVIVVDGHRLVEVVLPVLALLGLVVHLAGRLPLDRRFGVEFQAEGLVVVAPQGGIVELPVDARLEHLLDDLEILLGRHLRQPVGQLLRPCSSIAASSSSVRARFLRAQDRA